MTPRTAGEARAFVDGQIVAAIAERPHVRQMTCQEAAGWANIEETAERRSDALKAYRLFAQQREAVPTVVIRHIDGTGRGTTYHVREDALEVFRDRWLRLPARSMGEFPKRNRRNHL